MKIMKNLSKVRLEFFQTTQIFWQISKTIVYIFQGKS